MRVIYTVIIYLYAMGIHVARLFSKQARLWHKGRKGSLDKMRKALMPGGDLVWFHCASLGEFEQGRPVIERFRKEFPEHQLLLTFFSPSGYEVRKDYDVADYVFYIPLDTPGSVKHFLDIWEPRMAVFIKYEYWFNCLHELKNRNIPIVIVSAVFRPEQYFFKPYGIWFGKHLKGISHFFVQNQESSDLLQGMGITATTITGDTRFDRVNELSSHPKQIHQIESFARDNAVLVAGSTWEKDEQLIASAINSLDMPLKLIIAPHQIHEPGLARLHKLFGDKTVRFSTIKDHVAPEVAVVIVDSMGILSHLYQYGHIAYIGGGFGKGIHNILEAATYGMPVLFGPKHEKFIEAKELCERGGAQSVNTAGELQAALRSLLSDDAVRDKASYECKDYVRGQSGATASVIAYLKKVLK